MKPINTLLLALLSLSLYASDLTITPVVTSFDGVQGSVEVTIRNTAVKVSIPLRVSVTATMNGITETITSIPFEAVVQHPVKVDNFRLSLPNDWLQLNTPNPFILNDGEATTFTITFGKVQVIR